MSPLFAYAGCVEGCSAAGLLECSRTTYVTRFRMWRRIILWSPAARKQLLDTMLHGKYHTPKFNEANWMKEVERFTDSDGKRFPVYDDAVTVDDAPDDDAVDVNDALDDDAVDVDDAADDDAVDVE